MATKGKPSHKYKKYKIEDGKLVRAGKTCPKCGPGVFLAEHKDRWHCGRCGYTEFKKKE
ncbi:MAG: 30S ribosomal protein S27ae [Candidatus Diapherotrites archaeon]|nr:30S ribosomal protein S27ae [Candidatus Diapherotrites archaeon]